MTVEYFLDIWPKTILILSLIIFVIAWLINPNIRGEKAIRNPRSFINVIGYVMLISLFAGMARNILLKFQDDPVLKLVTLMFLFLIFFAGLVLYWFLIYRREWTANKIFVWSIITYIFLRIFRILSGRRK